MPTKRLLKSTVHSQRTETKENLLSLGKVAGGRMARKRSLSDPGDPGNAEAAVLRLSQANNPNAAQTTDPDDDNEGISRRVNSARLYAQSLQKMGTRKTGKSKRMKISSDSNSLVNARSAEDGIIAGASSSACEQSFTRMSVNRDTVSSTANQSAVSTFRFTS